MGLVIDSPEIIQAKRRIMLNQPHLEHASGNLFTCNIAEPPLKNVIIYFGPDQRGSGTPSGSNKRPIYDVNEVSFRVGEQLYTKTLTGFTSSFNGSYNCETGDIVISYTSQTATSSSSFSSFTTTGDSAIFWLYYSAVTIYNNPQLPLYCSMFTFTGYHYNYATVPDWSFAGSASYKNSAWFKIPKSVLSIVSLDGVKQWVGANNSIQVVGPRQAGVRTGNVGTLSVSAPRGAQIIDAIYGDNIISLDYWTH